MTSSIAKTQEYPGWNGPGIPTIGELLFRRPVAAAKLLFRGQFFYAMHLGVSGFVDLWNFYALRSGQPGVECPCCGWTGPAFLAKAHWRNIQMQSGCPQCNSRSRHRGLARMLPQWLALKPEGDVLIFAPEYFLLKYMDERFDIHIVTTDLNRVDVDFPGEDIRRLSFPDQRFAMLVCNHVLEHVSDDTKAIAECSRVLKPGGIAIFTVPGDFNKPDTWVFDRAAIDGHLRHYGMDILDKFKLAFDQVEAIDMGAVVDAKWGVRQGDYVFVCIKSI